MFKEYTSGPYCNPFVALNCPKSIGKVKNAIKEVKVKQAPGGGGTPRKTGWGCAARFPKSLPYL